MYAVEELSYKVERKSVFNEEALTWVSLFLTKLIKTSIHMFCHFDSCPVLGSLLDFSLMVRLAGVVWDLKSTYLNGTQTKKG